MFGIFSNGVLIARYASEQLANVNCIAMRRAGWIAVYVERITERDIILSSTCDPVHAYSECEDE